MSRHRRPVSDSELEVLKALWSGGPGTARDVERLFERREPRWAYNTILTLLSRLRDKGYVRVDRRGAAHVFRAAVTREELLTSGLSRMVDRICDGTASPLVHALLRGGRFSAGDLADLRRLLDTLDKDRRS